MNGKKETNEQFPSFMFLLLCSSFECFFRILSLILPMKNLKTKRKFFQYEKLVLRKE